MARIFNFIPRSAIAKRAHVTWETRYAGVLSVAMVDEVPVAGISGPWPDGHFALTWWSTRDSDVAPTLEFYSTMDAARTRVEHVTAHLTRAAA